jgi:hypothetical protein
MGLWPKRRSGRTDSDRACAVADGRYIAIARRRYNRAKSAKPARWRTDGGVKYYYRNFPSSIIFISC